MVTFSRELPRGHTEQQIKDTELSIRNHLSACASAYDSEWEFAGEVAITYELGPDEKLTIIGSIARDPQADYLQPDYNPTDSGEYQFQPWRPA
jgi:hypothetical protein